MGSLTPRGRSSSSAAPIPGKWVLCTPCRVQSENFVFSFRFYLLSLGRSTTTLTKGTRESYIQGWRGPPWPTAQKTSSLITSQLWPLLPAALHEGALRATVRNQGSCLALLVPSHLSQGHQDSCHSHLRTAGCHRPRYWWLSWWRQHWPPWSRRWGTGPWWARAPLPPLSSPDKEWPVPQYTRGPAPAAFQVRTQGLKGWSLQRAGPSRLRFESFELGIPVLGPWPERLTV